MKLAVSLLLLVIVAPAFADQTGNDVLRRCQTTVRYYEKSGGPTGELFDAGWCPGWVNAALSLNGLHHEWGKFVKEEPGLMQFCTPDGVTVIQAVRILVNYLSEHPDQLHEDGMGLTIAALKASFPCSPQVSQESHPQK